MYGEKASSWNAILNFKCSTALSKNVSESNKTQDFWKTTKIRTFRRMFYGTVNIVRWIKFKYLKLKGHFVCDTPNTKLAERTLLYLPESTSPPPPVFSYNEKSCGGGRFNFVRRKGVRMEHFIKKYCTVGKLSILLYMRKGRKETPSV